MNTHVVSALAWERLLSAVEKARQRLSRAALALETAGIPYAVIGDNAIAAWVSEVDLVDGTWPSRLPRELGQRLQQLLDNPEG